MSGYDSRTKGKRFRKPQSGSSNVKERWKYLSAQTDDVLHGSSNGDGTKDVGLRGANTASTSTKKQQQLPRAALGTAPVHSTGFDIDGDGQIDVREMRLAKFLDAMVNERQQQKQQQQRTDQQGHEQHTLGQLTETELARMRQEAGRLLIAKEFVERNHDRLWRYGSVFTGKSEQQSAEFIASHKNFKKLMPFLENLERKRTIRSSQNLRGCVQPEVSGASGSGEQRHRDPQEDARLVRQTWIETSRKVPDVGFSKHPLPVLQPKKHMSVTELYPVSETPDDIDRHNNNSSSKAPVFRPDVRVNAYGAVDVDGDGIVDDDEMKLNLRLQEATLNGSSSLINNNNNRSSHGDRTHSQSTHARETRQRQQLEGRRMLARDFVERNAGQLWLYEPSYRDMAPDDVAHAIASSVQFTKEFNRLRAKERVFRLKSSAGVSNCLVQAPTAELPVDPSHAMEFRRVRHRSELLLARKELLKPAELAASATAAQQQHPGALRLRAVREDRRELSRTASDTQIVGLPRIYDTPVKIEATVSFSVTKWKFGD